VIGADAHQPRFFWLAGQGGYGIQSAAGASLLAATLLTAQRVPDELESLGVQRAPMAPQRLRR
jgi:D-arginine dehydrogenase